MGTDAQAPARRGFGVALHGGPDQVIAGRTGVIFSVLMIAAETAGLSI
jgi:hypothetical protein